VAVTVTVDVGAIVPDPVTPKHEHAEMYVLGSVGAAAGIIRNRAQRNTHLAALKEGSNSRGSGRGYEVVLCQWSL
jgi:hypothetical protein